LNTLWSVTNRYDNYIAVGSSVAGLFCVLALFFLLGSTLTRDTLAWMVFKTIIVCTIVFGTTFYKANARAMRLKQAEIKAVLKRLEQMMGIEGVLKNVFDDVFHQMISSNPSGAAGLMEMTDDQLVRQLAGLSAGAAVFGGVDDADGLGVGGFSDGDESDWMGTEMEGTDGGFGMSRKASKASKARRSSKPKAVASLGSTMDANAEFGDGPRGAPVLSEKRRGRPRQPGHGMAASMESEDGMSGIRAGPGNEATDDLAARIQQLESELAQADQGGMSSSYLEDDPEGHGPGPVSDISQSQSQFRS
jgi:hypothetical protein